MIDDPAARTPWYRAHLVAVIGGTVLLGLIATSAIVLFTAGRGRATALSGGADVQAPRSGRSATTTATPTTPAALTHPAATSTTPPTTLSADSVLASGLDVTGATPGAAAPATTPAGTTGLSRDVTPPVIVITEPPEGTHVAHPNVLLRGIAEGGTRVATTGGRHTTAGPKGYWQLDVALVDGRNDLVVTATDAAGNTASASIVVFYDARQPGLAPSTDLGPTPIGSSVATPPQSGPVTASVPLDTTAVRPHKDGPAITTATAGGS